MRWYQHIVWISLVLLGQIASANSNLPPTKLLFTSTVSKEETFTIPAFNFIEPGLLSLPEYETNVTMCHHAYGLDTQIGQCWTVTDTKPTVDIWLPLKPTEMKITHSTEAFIKIQLWGKTCPLSTAWNGTSCIPLIVIDGKISDTLNAGEIKFYIFFVPPFTGGVSLQTDDENFSQSLDMYARWEGMPSKSFHDANHSWIQVPRNGYWYLLLTSSQTGNFTLSAIPFECTLAALGEYCSIKPVGYGNVIVSPNSTVWGRFFQEELHYCVYFEAWQLPDATSEDSFCSTSNDAITFQVNFWNQEILWRIVTHKSSSFYISGRDSSNRSLVYVLNSLAIIGPLMIFVVLFFRKRTVNTGIMWRFVVIGFLSLLGTVAIFVNTKYGSWQSEIGSYFIVLVSPSLISIIPLIITLYRRNILENSLWGLFLVFAPVPVIVSVFFSERGGAILRHSHLTSSFCYAIQLVFVLQSLYLKKHPHSAYYKLYGVVALAALVTSILFQIFNLSLYVFIYQLIVTNLVLSLGFAIIFWKVGYKRRKTKEYAPLPTLLHDLSDWNDFLQEKLLKYDFSTETISEIVQRFLVDPEIIAQQDIHDKALRKYFSDFIKENGDEYKKLKKEYLEVSTELLGRGSTATVTKGQYKLLSVAVKKLHPEMAKNPSVRTWFVNEAKISALLVHPHILKTLGVVFYDDLPVIIMELAQKTLKDLCQEQTAIGPFQPILIHEILLSIAVGLNYLHTFGIAHRDMNLGNFLIINGVVKLSDFGLGKRVESDTSGASLTGGVGALLFRAPEAFTNKYNTKCDIWSFGVLMWMLWGVGRPEKAAESLIVSIDSWFEDDCDQEILEHFKRAIGITQLEELAKIRSRALIEVHDCPYLNLVERCLCLDANSRPCSYKLVGDLLDTQIDK